MEIDFAIDSCRICLRNKGVVHLFKNLNNKTSVVGMIHFITNEHLVHHVNLPRKICTPCIQKIKFAIKVKKDIINTDFMLKKYLKVNGEPEEQEHSELQLDLIEFKKSPDNSDDDDGEPVVWDHSVSSLADIEDCEDGATNDNTLENPIEHCDNNYKNTTVEDSQDKEPEEQEPTENDDGESRVWGQSAPLDIEEYEHLGKSSKITSLVVEKLGAVLSEDRLDVSTVRKVNKLDTIKIEPILGVYSESLPDVPNKYSCELCDSKLDTLPKFIVHMKVHPEAQIYECEMCGKKFRCRSRYMKHSLIHATDSSFVCSICNKAFKGDQNLRQHLLTHRTEKTFPCPKCDKTFAHTKGLNYHLLYHLDKTLACSTCGKSFGHTTLLKAHMRIVHSKLNGEAQNNVTKTKQFYCNLCDRLFASHQYLKSHEYRIHNKTRKFKCECCSATFSSFSALNKHMQRHINTVMDPKIKDRFIQLKCHICDKLFTCRTLLKKHLIIHTGAKEHACKDCGKKFALQIYLERHIRGTHDIANSRNFVCNVCGKVVTDITTLRVHMRGHTGEMPFSCEFCNSKFVYAKSMRQHVAKQHADKVAQRRAKNL